MPCVLRSSAATGREGALDRVEDLRVHDSARPGALVPLVAQNPRDRCRMPALATGSFRVEPGSD